MTRRPWMMLTKLVAAAAFGSVVATWAVGQLRERDVLVPHVAFKMYVGKGDDGPVPSSLSHEAGMALWDKISSSIRLHHTSPRQVARPSPSASTPAS